MGVTLRACFEIQIASSYNPNTAPVVAVDTTDLISQATDPGPSVHLCTVFPKPWTNAQSGGAATKDAIETRKAERLSRLRLPRQDHSIEPFARRARIQQNLGMIGRTPH